jgi:hypothetical protein
VHNMSNEKVTIQTESGFEFKYDRELSYLQNYQKWRVLNQQERSAYNETHLSAEEAEQSFSQQYGNFK